jgi:hypothetical protein
MNTFFLALFRPEKTFYALKTEDKFSAMSLIILLLLILINLFLVIPITAKIAAVTFSSMSLPENQIETMTQITYKMRYLQVIGLEIIYLIMFFFYALLLYIFVRIAKDKLTYKRALQLIVYAYFIVVVGDLVNTALNYLRGVDSIKNIYDASLIGINLLTSIEQVGSVWYTFLTYFTPFQLWFVILLSIGLKIFTNMKYIKSFIISVLFWLITILIPVLSVYFSELTTAKSGIM